MAFANPSAPDRIIVGLDFGTTYSGLAWTETHRPDHRESITTWPAGDDFSNKVPTRLRYAGGEMQWGFGVPVDAPPEEVIEWFKLDLDPSLLPLKEAVSNRNADNGVDVLVADYISAMLTYLTSTLTQRLGRQILTSTLDIVLAVPAVWSDAAKARIRQICETASGAPVRLVSEPEAAATYTIRELDLQGLSMGDTIVVVDAGGGTVDLTSYAVRALDPLEVEEAAPATGALCGAAFLDMRFAKYLRAMLGGAEGFDEGVLAGTVAHFEKLTKRKFTSHAHPSETYPISVPSLPDNASLDVRNGVYSLPVPDLRTIFEPVILETRKLVSEHVSSLPAPPKVILLVGGFGSSNYLRESLEIVLGGMEIHQPRGAWQAVAQGAVMKGLAVAERERSAGEKRVRRYGVELVARYDEGMHSPIRGKRHWCGLDGCYKGSAADEPLETTFHWTSPISKGRIRTVKLDMYTREADGPPPLSRDTTVAPLRRVEVDLSAVPEGRLKRRQGLDGRWYYDLRCGIEAVRVSKGQRYALVYNSRRYDATTVEYA